MTAVLGLDLSTKRTGVAFPDGRTFAWVPPKPTPGARLHWLFGQLARTLRRFTPEVVVAESVAVHTHPQAAQSLAQLHGVLRLAAFEAGVDVVDVNPTRLKRYATGRGNADKDDMVTAARAAGAVVAGDDEADAWLLRALGLQAMDGADLLAGSQGADPGHRLEVVAAHTWPVVAR